MQQAPLLLLFLPLLGFLINGLGYGFLRRKVVAWIGCSTVGGALALTLVLFAHSLTTDEPLRLQLFDWIKAGTLHVAFGLLTDRLTLVMLLVITGVGFLIHVYSVGYMWDDVGFGKFFAFLNLFVFFMLLLVLADSFLVMFIGWEGVGLCSYLLIGFWWKNHEYTAAANKAFIMNRIGDLGFLLALFLMFRTFGSTQYDVVFQKASAFVADDPTLVAITMLLFVGAIGKSAQIPLYTWLPDAMAGPTPVSALIHAATMVTAGVYLVVRAHVLYALAPTTLTVILWIGTATALWAALIALTQDDIKKVLAYSTVSQLGYMFAAAGSLAFVTSMFHLVTHAFFKALLFLGAGSVIHALHHEQNMRNMGGLRALLPVTFGTMVVGTLAISGAPPLAGFFSKDEILLAVSDRSVVAFLLLAVTALLTSVYMFRLLFLVFYGSCRTAPHQREKIHEASAIMRWPLLVLAALSAIGGFLGLPALFGNVHALSGYLHPIFVVNPRLVPHEHAHAFEIFIMCLSVALVVLAAYLTYRRYHLRPVERSVAIPAMPRWYRWSYYKFYVDELYNSLIVRPAEWLGDYFQRRFEPRTLDAVVEGTGRFAQRLGQMLTGLQTGSVAAYLLWMMGSLIALLWYALFKS
ncbi:MAG: NADH-quinone oxidoreductase subunit L [Chitinophagales bacterium]|nr:NADH-quinone oxidoreductase subunit L [Chitinophagales bacterium]MDW8428408.1 NADH-quinone oxidoreductase subunit L [Chitinophagales bacterium]